MSEGERGAPRLTLSYLPHAERRPLAAPRALAALNSGSDRLVPSRNAGKSERVRGGAAGTAICGARLLFAWLQLTDAAVFSTSAPRERAHWDTGACQGRLVNAQFTTSPGKKKKKTQNKNKTRKKKPTKKPQNASSVVVRTSLVSYDFCPATRTF